MRREMSGNLPADFAERESDWSSWQEEVVNYWHEVATREALREILETGEFRHGEDNVLFSLTRWLEEEWSDHTAAYLSSCIRELPTAQAFFKRKLENDLYHYLHDACGWVEELGRALHKSSGDENG